MNGVNGKIRMLDPCPLLIAFFFCIVRSSLVLCLFFVAPFSISLFACSSSSSPPLSISRSISLNFRFLSLFSYRYLPFSSPSIFLFSFNSRSILPMSTSISIAFVPFLLFYSIIMLHKLAAVSSNYIKISFQ